jgi:hypothetical protein
MIIQETGLVKSTNYQPRDRVVKEYKRSTRGQLIKSTIDQPGDRIDKEYE